MVRQRKQPKDDPPAGAPEWMVTFSDCMTLLLTFFVLLLSFSSFDKHVFPQLRIIFANAFPAVSSTVKRNKEAFLPTRQIQSTDDIDQGSEKPTLTTGRQDGLKEQAGPVDFYNRKVFLIPSGRIFWGKGGTISLQGRNILAEMASFLEKVPSRIVICEYGPVGDGGKGNGGKDDGWFGLPRAWAVVEYLTAKQGLDKGWFSISAMSTVAPVDSGDDAADKSEIKDERMLEIILLERSLYN